jgi:hypothetical protein
MSEPDVTSGGSAELTIPPTPDQIHPSTVERAFDLVKDLDLHSQVCAQSQRDEARRDGTA